MGMRAIATITGTRYYRQWGSPAYQLPILATWLRTSALTHQLPTSTTYDGLVATFGLDGFTERHPDPNPRDLDWTYDVQVTGTDTAWTATIEVHGPQLWKNDTTSADVARYTVTTDDMHDLAQGITQHAETMARTLLNLAGRIPDAAAEAAGWQAIAQTWQQES